MLYIYFYLYTALSSIILISCLLLSKVLNEICSLFMPFYVERETEKSVQKVSIVWVVLKWWPSPWFFNFHFCIWSFQFLAWFLNVYEKKKKNIACCSTPFLFWNCLDFTQTFTVNDNNVLFWSSISEVEMGINTLL